MAIKQRAMAVEDKEERRNAILDAAETLFLDQPDRMANMAEVADVAGVAKGTVYLYFPSKEEMLLALHERHVAAFFDDLVALLDRPGPHSFDAIFAVTRKHIIRDPGYLPLTSICFGLMDREIGLERALEFKVRVGQMLAAAGSRLERHYAGLKPGGGVALLCNSYGLMVGMWQMLNPNKRFGAALERPELRMFRVDYEREIELALRALWTGTLSRDAETAAVHPLPKRKKK